MGQRQDADKSTEITAVPELLRSLEWAGCIVTLDAMGCQKSRARLKNAGENPATLRRWSLNLLKAQKLRAKRSLKGGRKSSGWDNAYLLYLLGLH